MVERFDIDNICKGAYKVGKLNSEIIELLGLKIPESDILIGADKIVYTQKHKHKFEDSAQYKKCIEATPDIINNPDYVGVHPNGQSIEYIKTIDKTMLLAVRINSKGSLWVKTVFPITEQKLELYINSGTVKKC